MSMVASLTIGKEKYAQWDDSIRAAKAQAETLYKGFAEAIDKDTEAFNLVAAAYKMPKETGK